MKTSIAKIGSLLLVCGLLSGCSPEGGPVYLKEGETPRLVDKSQYLVDFANGYSEDFFFANNYKNSEPFNCYWTDKAGSLVDETMKLTLFKENDTIYGAEYRSKKYDFHYGYYAVNMKAANCPGVISSFFTYTHYPVWDEIDIEFLGKNMTQIQLNYYTNGKGRHEYIYNLGFDASLDFHEYGFEWLENSIKWYVDGVMVHEANEDIPSHSQSLMMNLWNCINHNLWSGRFDESKLPVSSFYKYIAYIPANS